MNSTRPTLPEPTRTATHRTRLRRRLPVSIGVVLALGLTLVAATASTAGADTAPTAGPAPTPAPETSTADWTQVSAGLEHTCAIRTSGRLYCWGSDQYGQLGNGPATTDDQLAPVEVAGGATNWASVTAGGYHTCALKTNGKLFCWGYDGEGELGNGGNNTNRDIPVAVAARATTVLWKAVDAGNSHTCAIRTNGRMYCWGLNGNGQLGNNDPNTDQSVPVPVTESAQSWTSVSAGGSHTCGILSTRLFCWGRGADGELGRGTLDRPVPTEVNDHTDRWIAVSAGAAHTCAIRGLPDGYTDMGRLFCWGNDGAGQIGDGGTVGENHPTPTAEATGNTHWISVTAGDYQTCARLKTAPGAGGTLLCWGSDSDGQLGNGPSPSTNQPAPVGVAGGANTWSAVSAGGFHTCALKTSGRLFCWGFDENGALGDGGTPTSKPSPSQVA